MSTAVNSFISSVKSICPEMSEEDLSFFESKLFMKTYRRKEVYLEAGEIQTSIGFVAEGLVRSYYVDQNGDEINTGFYSEGNYATHYASYLNQKPSSYSIQCLEPTVLVGFTFKDHQMLYQHSENFERYGRRITEAILIQQQERIESFVFDSAEKRYLDFIEKNKLLFNRISISQLSSYLGIERQSLTRIRQKLAHH